METHTIQPYVQWKEAPNSVQIRKPNGQILELSVGNLISIKKQVSDRNIYFKIDAFVGDQNEIGPVCFDYREFDITNKCFIESPFSLKMGNKSWIVCYPTGIKKYGYHLNNNEWSSITISDLESD
jgi:hypothetical protein